MSEREDDREQLDFLLDKLDTWNAEFDKLETQTRKAGTDPEIEYDE